MTLLIALIVNHICQHITGEQYIGTGWIVLIWILHLFTKASSK